MKKLFRLTIKQKLFLMVRKLKVDGLYMFPSWGFTIVMKNGERDRLDTNPISKSLSGQHFIIKEITEGVCFGNFYHRPSKEDFGIPSDELEKRGLLEMFFVTIFCVPCFWIYNIFKKEK